VALGSCLVLALISTSARSRAASEPGLLFFVSGDREFVADYSRGGTPEPTFVSDVRIVPDGARGSAIQCGHTQLLAYRAPGNIYAARGTLSLFWRSREPVGATPFPVFRVGYADHSSWDMVWLRIDYNGAGLTRLSPTPARTHACHAQNRLTFRHRRPGPISRSRGRNAGDSLPSTAGRLLAGRNREFDAALTSPVRIADDQPVQVQR
jgi:hypothetical protein